MKILTQFSGKIYPDKTLTLGRVPRKVKRLEDSLYDLDCEDNWDSYKEIKYKWGKLKITNVAFLSSDKGKRTYQEAPTVEAVIEHVYQNSDYFQESVPCLDRLICCDIHEKSLGPILDEAPKSSQTRGSYGKKGITTTGKRIVRGSTMLLQERYSKRCLGFCTATIPNFEDDDIRILCRHWSDVTRRFFQELKRCANRSNHDFLYVGCSEIQSKRYRKTGIAVPHLHWVYRGKCHKNEPWIIHVGTMRAIWKRVLLSVLAANGGSQSYDSVEFNAAIDATSIRKSAASYIGKYLSKGMKFCKEIIDEGFEDLPKQWWFASMQMKKMYKEAIINLSSEICQDLFYDLEFYLHEGFVKWASYIYVEMDGVEKCFGLAITLTRDGYDRFWNQLCPDRRRRGSKAVNGKSLKIL